MTDIGFVVTVTLFQQQHETNNCGLFSIAAAVHVAKLMVKMLAPSPLMKAKYVLTSSHALSEENSPFPKSTAAEEPPVE